MNDRQPGIFLLRSTKEKDDLALAVLNSNKRENETIIYDKKSFVVVRIICLSEDLYDSLLMSAEEKDDFLQTCVSVFLAGMNRCKYPEEIAFNEFLQWFGISVAMGESEDVSEEEFGDLIIVKETQDAFRRCYEIGKELIAENQTA